MKQMKKLLVCTMLLAMLGCLNVVAQSLKGDVNEDGKVDVADISTILSLMAGYEPGGDDNPSGDGHAPENAKTVDLGLPSGTLWANMNVGATSPQENGLYFAWGETKGYISETSDGRLFDWASYKWITEGQSSELWINKYQVVDNHTDGCWYHYNWDVVDYEFIGDGKATLDPEDDAAAVNWGGGWRMPTYEDFTELLNNTTNEWITVGSVTGCKFTSKTNGNSIFFPAAGFHNTSLQSLTCNYWSSSLHPLDTYFARFLHSNLRGAAMYDSNRYNGFSVRPVLKK